MKKRIPLDHVIAFFSGLIIYPSIEIIYRQRTHYSMALAGALGMYLIYLTCENFPRLNIFLKALIGCGIITTIEFTFGVIFNIFLGQNVWDYRGLRINFLGQISLFYSFLWFLLSFFVIFLCKLLRDSFPQKNRSDT